LKLRALKTLSQIAVPIIGAFFLLVGCARDNRPSVRVFAAASTREALEELAAKFEAETNTKVHLNFGPSSDLARQIERGADADLFLAADEAWGDYLARKALVEGRKNLCSNRLVVVVPTESTLKLRTPEDLTQAGIVRLALAGETVPAGKYGREVLEHAGILDRVKARIRSGEDVRSVLAYVARGEADAGIVYATDPQGNSKVKVAFEIDPKLHSPIRYSLIVIRRSPIGVTTRQFFQFLISPKAVDTFRRYGFTPPL
jgi:molybdate transport system substrate-binding protein